MDSPTNAADNMYRASIKPNEEDSNVIAAQLRFIAQILHTINWNYFQVSMVAMEQMALQYDAQAVLNRMYTPDRGKVLAAQAQALRTLWDYRQQLIQIDALKKTAEKATSVLQMMASVFK